jgi:hypothetical protein
MSASPSCLYCNDTGVLSVITTSKGEFKIYCNKCHAGAPQNPPPLPVPTPPTNDIVRE